MKNREKCSDFSRRHSYIKHAWCALLAVSLLTADGALRGEEGLELQTNVHTTSDRRTLPANGACLPAAAMV